MPELKLNAKCEDCKDTGITYDGKCVQCIDPKMNLIIGPQSVAKITKDIAEMLIVHRGEISQAYDNGDESLTINLPVKIVVGEGEGVKVVTSMSFSTGKISDSRACTIDEKQKKLFED